MVAACWNEISASTIRLSWRKILPEGSDPQDVASEFNEHPTAAEFGSMFQLLNQEMEDDDNIEDWLECDGQDMGCAHLNGDEIVSRVAQEPMQ